MLFLPELLGRFPVGATTFTTPIRPSRTVGTVKLRSTRQPALKLEEVAFTAYYPTDPDATASKKKGIDWVLRPVRESLRGFASFTTMPLFVLWPLVYLFGAFVKIPVYPNAPLLNPNKAKSLSPALNEKLASGQWPLVIFSHGLGGGRTIYSQLCSRIAASGKVVLALEHRDGSGIVATPRTWGDEGKVASKPIPYYQPDHVILEKYTDPLHARTEQLDFRRQEIYAAYEAFCGFIKKDPSLEFSTADDSAVPVESWSMIDSNSGQGPVRYSEGVTLAGHSFGGCTILTILSMDPPKGSEQIPATNALILDPWLEPLPTPDPTPKSSASSVISAVAEHSTSDVTTVDGGNEAPESPKRDPRLPQMLVINSEVFTLWKDHFARLQDIIKAWEPQGRRIITVVGSKHIAFSDFPVLPLIRNWKSKKFMEIISDLSIAFIDGELEEAVCSSSERNMEIEVVGKKKDGKPMRKLVGSVGDIVLT